MKNENQKEPFRWMILDVTDEHPYLLAFAVVTSASGRCKARCEPSCRRQPFIPKEAILVEKDLNRGDLQDLKTTDDSQAAKKNSK